MANENTVEIKAGTFCTHNVLDLVTADVSTVDYNLSSLYPFYGKTYAKITSK